MVGIANKNPKPQKVEVDVSETNSTGGLSTPDTSPTSVLSMVPGDVFAGRYRIEQLIGEGGMGRVYRAQDLVLGETIALKVLPQQTPELHDQLLNEVRLARQVTHACVCRVFDFGQTDGETYLTMQFVDGEDLDSLLRKVGRLTRHKVYDLARRLCAGLAAVHERDILHQDLKPTNLLIDLQGRLQITDFGISSSIGETGRAQGGTPAYMAPELFAGRPANVRSDIYSLGLVLYEVATGKPLFTARKVRDLLKAERRPEALSVGRDLDHIDPGMAEMIVRCLQPNPEKRPQSVTEVAAALPGIDALKLALDAGKTPSPEAVAGAESQPIGRVWLTALASLGLLLLMILPGLSDLAFPNRENWHDRSPEVLSHQASQILKSLGHDEEPRDRAWGYFSDSFAAGDQGSGLFWYRQSPSPMLSHDYRLLGNRHGSSYYDPPPLGLGMVQMLLDYQGKLVTFKRVTTSVSLAMAEPEPLVAPVDWSAAWRAVGVDADSLRPIDPVLLPPYYAEEHRAWEAQAVPGVAARRIEAARMNGKIVFVDVRPVVTPMLDVGPWGAVLERLSFYLAVLLALVLPVSCGFLARQNWLRNRGDWAGARRLLLFVLAVRSIAVVLTLDGDALSRWEMERLFFHGGQILLEGLMVWAVYMAFEPVVRRFWHQPLVAWSRWLRGSFRDPLVGLSLLMGGLMGVLWSVFLALDEFLGRAAGLPTVLGSRVFGQMEKVMSARVFLSNLADSSVEAVYFGVSDLCLLVLLRLVFRRPIPAIAVFVVVRGLWETLAGWNPQLSWLTLGLGLVATGVWLLVRWGLLAYVTAMFCHLVLTELPITWNTDAWFAVTSYGVVAIVTAIGFWGFQQALDGRPWLTADPEIDWSRVAQGSSSRSSMRR